MIKAGIIGGSGYVSGELLRCLVHHPEIAIDFVYSHSLPDSRVQDVHQDLLSEYDLRFTSQINLEVDILFLSLGHGQSRKFLKENTFSEKTKIIDLSQVFRLAENGTLNNMKFRYGLVELYHGSNVKSNYIANPGCFATTIELALLPLASENDLESSIHIHAITGSTGAGCGLKETSHFSWRNNNVSIYKAFKHQHNDEILQSLKTLQPDFSQSLNFVPVRGDFTRGIYATVYTQTDLDEISLKELYKEFYKNAAFTKLIDKTVHLKQVVNTNYCALQVQKIDDKVLITSAIDNLLKGAAGQAIQNMNLMFDLGESTGLNLKASYF